MQQEGCSACDELDGAFARDQVVVDNAPDGKHRKAAVLDLRELEAAKPKQQCVSAPQTRPVHL